MKIDLGTDPKRSTAQADLKDRPKKEKAAQADLGLFKFSRPIPSRLSHPVPWPFGTGQNWDGTKKRSGRNGTLASLASI